MCNSEKLSVPVVPSTRIFYTNYPYRIDFVGGRYDYDPDSHYLLNCFLAKNNIENNRSYLSESCRSIYFRKYEEVELVCLNFSNDIVKVCGPCSKKHLNLLKTKTDTLVLREKLFFNKFDTRLEFISRHDKNNVDFILQCVNANLSNYRWLISGDKWFYNFLYCNKKEFDQVFPFLVLSLDRYILKNTIEYVRLISTFDIDK